MEKILAVSILLQITTVTASINGTDATQRNLPDCINNDDYFFFNGRGITCLWADTNRKEYCKKHLFRIKCPKTCGACNGKESHYYSGTKKDTLESGDMFQTCQWLMNNSNNERRKLCGSMGQLCPDICNDKNMQRTKHNEISLSSENTNEKFKANILQQHRILNIFESEESDIEPSYTFNIFNSPRAEHQSHHVQNDVSINKCEDKPNFIFVTSHGQNVSCPWITKAKQEKVIQRQNKYCFMTDGVTTSMIGNSCSSSCGFCQQNSKNFQIQSAGNMIQSRIQCADDTEFFFQLSYSNEWRKCEWLTRNSKKTERRQSKYCIKSDIASACPLSCSLCDVSDTHAPSTTISMTPSVSPSKFSSTLKCKDNDDFLFALDYSRYLRKCAWLTKSNAEERIKKYCNRSHIRGACPLTCDSCSSCQDDDSFSFFRNNGIMAKCEWLANDISGTAHKRQTRYCNHNEIGSKCLYSCGFCIGTTFNRDNFVEETSAPSFTTSPTQNPMHSAVPSFEPSETRSHEPSSIPSSQPSGYRSFEPSSNPSLSLKPSSDPSLGPSEGPTSIPSSLPSLIPSSNPSSLPSFSPSSLPSELPSASPSAIPSDQPSESNAPSLSPAPTTRYMPSTQPSSSLKPSRLPTSMPSVTPSGFPSMTLSAVPSLDPSSKPSDFPSTFPSALPSSDPSSQPSSAPSLTHSDSPSGNPSLTPSKSPSSFPSDLPSLSPSLQPSLNPSDTPSSLPSLQTSQSPSGSPSLYPSLSPSKSHFPSLSNAPSQQSESPSSIPSLTTYPSEEPSNYPSFQPSIQPSEVQSMEPSSNPSIIPSAAPSSLPSFEPSLTPSNKPSLNPSLLPSSSPSNEPSSDPSDSPSMLPSIEPSMVPSMIPSYQPSSLPSKESSRSPSSLPSQFPSSLPSTLPSEIPSSVPTIITKEVPATKVPATKVPATKEPVTKEPVTKVPVTKVPVPTVATKEPVPITKQPIITKQPS